MIRPKRRCLKFEVSIDAGGGGLLHTGKTRVWTMTFLHGSSHVWIGVKIWTKILLCEKVTTVLLDAQLVEEDLEEWVLEEKRESATSQLHQNQPLARTSTDFSSQSRTLGYEQFWLQSNFCHRWFFSQSERNLVTNKVFEPASCAEVRTFIVFGQGQSGFKHVLKVKKNF